ncbi:hypothetical protein VNO77_14553 [Canavalia gladiata]|uniref:Uncharacterized protein n=1 Tax=Canavalia gladiata TaxID=3824 RepID=A0AAN9LYA4_CANGL
MKTSATYLSDGEQRRIDDDMRFSPVSNDGALLPCFRRQRASNDVRTTAMTKGYGMVKDDSQLATIGTKLLGHYPPIPFGALGLSNEWISCPILKMHGKCLKTLLWRWRKCFLTGLLIVRLRHPGRLLVTGKFGIMIIVNVYNIHQPGGIEARGQWLGGFDVGFPTEAALEHAPKHSTTLGRILRPIGAITKAKANKLKIEMKTFLGLQEEHPKQKPTSSLMLQML